MPSAFAQEKSTWYEPSAINFHLGETAPQERKGRGRRHADRTVGLRGSVAAAVFALERGPPGTLRRIYRSRRDMRHWRAREIILARDAVIGAGKEMADHKSFTIATAVQVYFCDPRSPWQRGSIERHASCSLGQLRNCQLGVRSLELSGGIGPEVKVSPVFLATEPADEGVEGRREDKAKTGHAHHPE